MSRLIKPSLLIVLLFAVGLPSKKDLSRGDISYVYPAEDAGEGR
jgi:hypothetical protein